MQGRLRVPRNNWTLLLMLLVQVGFAVVVYLSLVTRSPWREHELRIYPLFVLLNTRNAVLTVTLGLLGASIVGYLWVLAARGLRTRANLMASLITLAQILLSALALFIAVFVARYHPIDSVNLHGRVYNLLAESLFQMRCDPYCFPELIHLVECDSLSLVCTLVESPSGDEYIARGIFNWRAPYRTETIELRVEGDTLLGLINGEEALRYSPNER